MNTGEKRINYQMKIMYAFGICFVVAGHTSNSVLPLANNWFPLYAFHLALFVFVSGYFYDEKSEEHVLNYIAKKVKKLIIPLYLWNFFYAGLHIIMKQNGFNIGEDVTLKTLFVSPINNGHQFLLNLPGWFIIPLFMIQVYNVLVRKLLRLVFKSINPYIWFLFNLLLGICGVQLAIDGYNYEWYLPLVRMLYLLPFYSLGTLYKDKLERRDKLPSWMYFSIIIVAELVIIFIYRRTPSYVPSWCNCFTDGPVMPFIVAVLGIAFWLRVTRILVPSIGRNKIVNLIADNSYSIMINQYLGFLFVSTCYAITNKWFGIWKSFDFVLYKNKYKYFFLPRGINNFMIIYIVAGIFIPILISIVLKKVLSYIKNIKLNRTSDNKI